MAGRLSGLRSKIRDIQNGEGDRGFLWKIVAGVGYLVVHTWAGEVVRGRAAVGCREVAVLEAVKGDRWNGDRRLRGELPLR
jgi:hypothetical protein